MASVRGSHKMLVCVVCGSDWVSKGRNQEQRGTCPDCRKVPVKSLMPTGRTEVTK